MSSTSFYRNGITQLNQNCRLFNSRSLAQSATPKEPRQEWFETNDAWSLLDLKNAEDLRRKRRNGFFKLGYHYRKGNEDPGATMPRWEFHVPRCQERLAEDPAKWMKPRRSEA
ncbi:MAG: hypothetical protein HC780_10015 [Leptolyngbyaceae cyanobacterium CSU_1_3]|nr:hypothetical protein [Leptolyngbyaceae cyanobacterium CSU_1_3]